MSEALRPTHEQFLDMARKAAGGMLSYDEDGYRLSQREVEKFAKLIVRECANMAEAFHYHQYDFTGDLELHEYMKRHFGIEP